MKTVANTISIIFQPIFMPLFGILLLLQFPLFVYNFYQKLLITVFVFLFTGLIPAFVVLISMKTGKVSDQFISNRKERTIPYIISIISYFVGAIAISKFNMGKIVQLFMFGMTLSLIFISIINIFWKISAHAAGVGGLLGAILFFSYIMSINPVGIICLGILISGMVLSSRIYLKAHTPLQTLAGFFAGLMLVPMPVIVYLYI